MSDLERDRLYREWASAAARTTPELDAGVRQRVLSAYAARVPPRAFPAPYRWAVTGRASHA